MGANPDGSSSIFRESTECYVALSTHILLLEDWATLSKPHDLDMGGWGYLFSFVLYCQITNQERTKEEDGSFRTPQVLNEWVVNHKAKCHLQRNLGFAFRATRIHSNAVTESARAK
jgi:hypothetical protein